MRGHFSIVRKMFVRQLTLLTSWYSTKQSCKLYQCYRGTLCFQEFLYDAAWVGSSVVSGDQFSYYSQVVSIAVDHDLGLIPGPSCSKPLR